MTFSLLITLPTAPALADDPPLIATVADPYLEMHTGPGRGYPIFHVVEKGQTVEILKSRTDWFKVRIHQGIDGRERVGWVHRDQLGRTLSPSGEALGLAHAGPDHFQDSRWELGFASGSFEAAPALTAQAGYRLTENLTAEVQLTQAVGNFSDNILASVNIQNQPFPEWRVSPYFSLGAGPDPHRALRHPGADRRPHRQHPQCGFGRAHLPDPEHAVASGVSQSCSPYQ